MLTATNFTPAAAAPVAPEDKSRQFREKPNIPPVGGDKQEVYVGFVKPNPWGIYTCDVDGLSFPTHVFPPEASQVRNQGRHYSAEKPRFLLTEKQAAYYRERMKQKFHIIGERTNNNEQVNRRKVTFDKVIVLVKENELTREHLNGVEPAVPNVQQQISSADVSDALILEQAKQSPKADKSFTAEGKAGHPDKQNPYGSKKNG